MNRDDLMDALDNSRERLLMVLETLPDEALLYPGTIGTWSVADLLVHLTVWETELVTGMMHLDQGKTPERLLTALANRDSYNQARFQENVGRELDLVFDDLQGVRSQLEEWLESFSDVDLTKVGRFKSLGQRSLATLIQELSIAHELAHLPALAAFAQKWAQHNELITPLDITITPTDPNLES